MDGGNGPDYACLFEVASAQHGYFTPSQARSCGLSSALLAYHVKSGRFVHVQRGLYRLKEFPSSAREDVMAAWVGVGQRDAVVSHESALDLLGLSDVVPDAVHITVPRSRRYIRAPSGVVVHTTTVELDRGRDVVVRDGIPVTAPARSIVDAASTGTSPEHVVQASGEAVERGLVTASELLAAARARGRRVEEMAQRGVERAR